MKKKKLLLVVGVLSFVVCTFLLSLFLLVYNPWFYDWQFHENNVYDLFGYEETWSATYSLWDFMLFRTDTLSSFFSDQDKLHMFDVRNILYMMQIILLFSFAVLLSIFIIQCKYKGMGNFTLSIFRYSSYVIFSVVGLLSFFAVFFDVSFLWFHKLFFTNELWLMDPTNDLLIQLFPEAFFQFIFIFIIGLSFCFGFAFLFLSQYVRHWQKKYI